MRSLLAGLMLFAFPALAQDDSQITLKYDDGTGVTGELVDFTDDTFRIQASVGLIAIPADEVSCIGGGCPAGTGPEIASAPVTLTSLDGQLTISGDLLDYTNGDYVVATNVGEMRLKADQVACTGAGCPEAEADVDTYVVLNNGSTAIEGNLIRVEDGSYIIDVEQFGEMRVSLEAFECNGVTCP